MFEEHYIEKKIYSKRSVLEIGKKIDLLGVSTKLTVYSFLNIRLIGSIVIFLLVLYFSNFGFVLAPILSILYYVGISYVLIDYKIKIRTKKLESEALNFLEI